MNVFASLNMDVNGGCKHMQSPVPRVAPESPDSAPFCLCLRAILRSAESSSSLTFTHGLREQSQVPPGMLLADLSPDLSFLSRPTGTVISVSSLCLCPVSLCNLLKKASVTISMLTIRKSTFNESLDSAGFVGSDPGKYLGMCLALSLLTFQTQANITLWRAVKIITNFIIEIAGLCAVRLAQKSV